MAMVSDASNPLIRTRRYVGQAMSVPLLTAEREQELARRWRDRGDETALHELVSAYLRLVIATAAKYRGYGLPMGDMVQEGNVGLMQAAARFDPDRNVRFSTYASWWIRSAMQEYVLRNWSIVRAGTSATQKALFFNLRWLQAKIERGGQAQMSPAAKAKVARALKVSTREVDSMAQRLAARDQSLNEVVGEEGSDQWQDFLPDDGPNPEEIVMGRHDFDLRLGWLESALAELSPRERQIVHERLLTDERITLEEIGARLGITKERVRQIEHKAYAKLRAGVLKRSEDAEAPAAH